MRARLPFEFILTDVEVCELTGASSSTELSEEEKESVLSFVVPAICCLNSGEKSDFKLFKARYLVDPASSHMLVSKIKPCMSKYKPVLVKPRMAH